MFVSGVVQNKLADATVSLRAAVEEVLKATLAVSPDGCEALLRDLVSAAEALFEADAEYSQKTQYIPPEISFELAASINESGNKKRRANDKLHEALTAADRAGVPRRALCALGDANRAANEAILAIRRLRQPFHVTQL